MVNKLFKIANLYNLSKLGLSSDMATASYALKSIDILLQSGANFIDDTSFLLNAANFVALAMVNYPTVVISNIKTFFNYYDSMITNSVMRINKMKVLNSVSNSTLRNSTLIYQQQTTFQPIFQQIQEGINNLIVFYSKNYITLNMKI